MIRAGFLTLVTVCATTAVSFAQETDVVVVEGPGHELSEGTVIHPRVGFETGVISNLFYEEDDVVVTPVVRLIAGFAISPQVNVVSSEQDLILSDEDSAGNDDPPELDFRLGADVFLNTYPSSNERARDQSDFGGSVDGKVTVFPEGTVSFVARERFARDIRPRNFEGAGIDSNLNRDINNLMLGLVYQPGGRTIRLGVRYENTIDRFESSDSSFGNRLQHLIGARAQWKLLPITMLSLDASLGFFGALGDGELNGVPYKNSSNPLRVEVGIASAITEVTTVRGHVGYGNGFYSSGENFANVIGGVEFGWRYSELGRVRASYEYGFQDSVNANFFRDHAIRLRLDQQLGMIVLDGELSARLRGYRGIPAVIMGPPSRDDTILAAKVRAHYLLRDWLALVGNFLAVSDETDYRYFAVTEMDDPSYQRLEVSAGVQAAF